MTGSVFLSKKADRDVASIGSNPPDEPHFAFYGLPARSTTSSFSPGTTTARSKDALFRADRPGLRDVPRGRRHRDRNEGRQILHRRGRQLQRALHLCALLAGRRRSSRPQASLSRSRSALRPTRPPRPATPETPNNVNPQDLVTQINKVSNLIYAAFGPSTPGQPPAYIPIQAVRRRGRRPAPIIGPPGFNGYSLNVVEHEPAAGADLANLCRSATYADRRLRPRSSPSTPSTARRCRSTARSRTASTSRVGAVLQSADGTSFIPRPTVPQAPTAGVFGGNGLGALIGTPFSVAFQGSGAIPRRSRAIRRLDDDEGGRHASSTRSTRLPSTIMDSTGKSAHVGGGQYFIDTTDPDNPDLRRRQPAEIHVQRQHLHVNLSTTAAGRHDLALHAGRGRRRAISSARTTRTSPSTAPSSRSTRAGRRRTPSPTPRSTAPADDRGAHTDPAHPVHDRAGRRLARRSTCSTSPGDLGDMVLGVTGRLYTYDPVSASGDRDRGAQPRRRSHSRPG